MTIEASIAKLRAEMPETVVEIEVRAIASVRHALEWVDRIQCGYDGPEGAMGEHDDDLYYRADVLAVLSADGRAAFEQRALHWERHANHQPPGILAMEHCPAPACVSAERFIRALDR